MATPNFGTLGSLPPQAGSSSVPQPGQEPGEDDAGRPGAAPAQASQPAHASGNEMLAAVRIAAAEDILNSTLHLLQPGSKRHATVSRVLRDLTRDFPSNADAQTIARNALQAGQQPPGAPGGGAQPGAGQTTPPDVGAQPNG